MLTVPYGLLGRLDSACVSEASDLCSHTYTRTDKVKNEFKFTTLWSLILIFIWRAWQTVSFPPKYRCTDELWDNQKIVVLKRIIWSGCADIFRTCPWSYGSQNSTNATQPNCACLNHKERDKQKGFLRAGEGGIILLETIFWLDCADVFQSRDQRCSDINHMVIKRMICACRSRTYIFSATFSRIKTALFMYKHIHKHAPIRLRRCISAVFRQNLSWEWLNFRNLYTLIGQVICADLSAFSRFYWFR